MKVVRRKLKDGDRGVEQTVREMIRLAIRDSRKPAIRNLVRTFSSESALHQVRDVYEYVLKTISYKDDNSIAQMENDALKPQRKFKKAEWVTAPVHFVEGRRKYGDCDDMSTLLACLLYALGYRVRFRVLAWRRPDYTHVYVMVFLPNYGAWIPLDPVLRHRGFGGEKAPIIRRNDTPVTMGDLELVTLEDGPCGCNKSLGGCSGKCGRSASVGRRNAPIILNNNNYVNTGRDSRRYNRIFGLPYGQRDVIVNHRTINPEIQTVETPKPRIVNAPMKVNIFTRNPRPPRLEFA